MKLCQRREMQTERRHRKLVGSFAVWHNFMEFRDMGLPPNHGQKHPELNERSHVLSSSWVHRPPLTCTICCFCPGRHNSCTQSFGRHPWQTGKTTLERICNSSLSLSCAAVFKPRLSFYVSQKLGGCDEHQYVWDRPNLKLSKLKPIVHVSKS